MLALLDVISYVRHQIDFRTMSKTHPILDMIYGMRDMLPMSIAAATYGLAFGLLATQSGFSIVQAISMSAMVFGGSSQLVAMEQLTLGVGAASAILAGIALNMRILLVTATMQNVLTARPWWQIGLGTFFATDASVALMQSAKTRKMTDSYWYFFGGGASLYIIWIIVTAIGAFVSSEVPNPNAIGLDFAIIAIFIATLPGMWRGTNDIIPWLVASSIVISWGALFPEHASWGLIGGAVCGALLAGVTHER